jgi:phosphoenolpyruvate---glycerone phosphotransferase subunit DhaL
MGCDAARTGGALRRAAKVIAENRDELVELDRVIGDGDHGENMMRGFNAFVASLDQSEPDQPGGVVKLLATRLISTVGGAAGPLYGTAFLRAASAMGDTTELTAETVATALAAARDGVVARGKAEPGDKTMVDALNPAVDAASAAAGSGESIAAVLSAAADAADTGAEATIPLVARKGRASYLGERSAGHLDPGARSSALLLRALADAAAGE